MKKTKFLTFAPCEIPEETSEDNVMAVSQVLESKETRIVEISLFYRGHLKGRYFADKENYNVWIEGKWHTCRLKNAVRICMGLKPMKNDFYCYSTGMEWASAKDKKRVQEFLDTWSIDNYEEALNIGKKQKEMERKKDRINKQMADIPCVPDEVEEWLEKDIFPGNILFIKKTGKRTAYRCTACGCSSWKKKGWKHGEKTICPRCGQPVTANSRRREKTETAPVIVLQRYGDQWLERQFRAICKWTAEKKEIQMFEQIRAIIPKGERWGKVWYGTIREADEYEQDFWDRNPQNKRFLPSYLYPGNLQEVLPFGKLEQSGIDVLANRGRKFNVNKYITTFHARPYLEYLAKAGLIRLTAEIVDHYGWRGDPDEICTYAQTLPAALRLDGNRVSRMKLLDGGLSTLEWLQYEESENVKITQEALKYLTDKNLGVDECKDILRELKSVNRMVNYMKKQKISPKRLVTTWRDYLRMAKEEGYDTEDDIVRLPKDLKARHDYLVELRNKRADEEKLKGYAKLDQQIRERMPEARKYYWEDDKYMIIPAGTCKELMIEGRTLHHCVGSSDTYMEKMAAGKSWILFLRKKEDLEKAYYTIEINMKDDSILQYYSEFDRQPDKAAISETLRKFKRHIKREQKIRVAVSVENIA